MAALKEALNFETLGGDIVVWLGHPPTFACLLCWHFRKTGSFKEARFFQKKAEGAKKTGAEIAEKQKKDFEIGKVFFERGSSLGEKTLLKHPGFPPPHYPKKCLFK